MKLQKRFISYVTLLFMMSAGTCFASHPLVSDDAGTIEKGSVQVEVNGEIGKNRESVDGSTTKTNSKQFATAFGIGIADKLDLSIGFARPWSNGDVDGEAFKDTGSADFSIGLKLQVYENEGLSVALKPQFGYSYAVGNSNDHTSSYGAAAVLSKEFAPFAMHLNAGYTYNDYNLAEVKDSCRNNIWNFSLAGTYEILKEVMLVADLGVASNEDKTSNSMPAFGLVGAIYSLNKNLDLSAGIKLGLTKPQDDLVGIFGATIKF